MQLHQQGSRGTRALTLVSFSVTLALTGIAQAQAQQGGAYPTRPIRMIVPFAAGSSTDITVRRLEPHMSKTLGQTLLVDNRPGAVGVTGRAATWPHRAVCRSCRCRPATGRQGSAV